MPLAPFFRLLVEVVRAHVGIGPRVVDHVDVHLDTNALEKIGEPDAVDGFADAFVLQSVFGEEIDDLFGQGLELAVVLVRIQLHEGNDNGAHAISDFQRSFAAHQDGRALVITRRQRLGHDVDAMHAAHAALVVDFQGVVVI